MLVVPVVALFVWALATTGSDDTDSPPSAEEAPLRLQIGCSDYVLGVDDWQNGRITTVELRDTLVGIYDDVRTTELGPQFGDVLAALTGDDPTVIDQMRSLGDACAAAIPDES